MDMQEMHLRETNCASHASFRKLGRACGPSLRQSPFREIPGLQKCQRLQRKSHKYSSARGVVVCSSEVTIPHKVPEFYETEKEQSRKYRMTVSLEPVSSGTLQAIGGKPTEIGQVQVFSHEDWFKHRSTDRYLRHIAGMLQ